MPTNTPQNSLLGTYSSTLTTWPCHSFLTAFGGLVTAVAVWAVYGGDMFPREGDPTGSPEDWSREDMRRWLSAVSRPLFVPLFATDNVAAQLVPRKLGHEGRASGEDSSQSENTPGAVVDDSSSHFQSYGLFSSVIHGSLAF